jgi:hypothetical protein
MEDQPVAARRIVITPAKSICGSCLLAPSLLIRKRSCEPERFILKPCIESLRLPELSSARKEDDETPFQLRRKRRRKQILVDSDGSVPSCFIPGLNMLFPQMLLK